MSCCLSWDKSLTSRSLQNPPESSFAKEQRWEQSAHWKRRWKESASSVPGRRDCDYNLALTGPLIFCPQALTWSFMGNNQEVGEQLCKSQIALWRGKWGWNPLLELHHLPRCSHLGHLFLNLHHGTQWVSRGLGMESGAGNMVLPLEPSQVSGQ